MNECAALLAGQMRDVGITTEIIPTPRHPVVYGELLKPGAPTVLIYGHYDVQPPEPLELWHSPPFEPTIRDGKIYGRGTSDNKAQLFTYLKTVETMKATFGELPISLKFLYEGEEEIGSPNLKPFCEQNRERLAASLTYYSDSHIHESGRPILILGLKGMVYVELKARGTREDQHSMRATSVPSAAWRLVWALSTLKDANSRIAIRGFYDDVRPLTNLERTAVANIPVDEAKLKEFFGIDAFLKGRESSDYYFNLVSEPTCNIAGPHLGLHRAGQQDRAARGGDREDRHAPRAGPEAGRHRAQAAPPSRRAGLRRHRDQPVAALPDSVAHADRSSGGGDHRGCAARDLRGRADRVPEHRRRRARTTSSPTC